QLKETAPLCMSRVDGRSAGMKSSVRLKEISGAYVLATRCAPSSEALAGTRFESRAFGQVPYVRLLPLCTVHASGRSLKLAIRPGGTSPRAIFEKSITTGWPGPARSPQPQ